MTAILPDVETTLAALAGRLDAYQVEGWSEREGEEFHRALATVSAASLARTLARTEGRYIHAATGAARAVGQVRITWGAPPTLAVGLASGQAIVKTPWGVTYALAEPVAQPAFDPAPTWLGGYLDGNGVVYALAAGALAAPDALAAWSLVAVIEPPDPIAVPGGSGLAGDTAMRLYVNADTINAYRETVTNGGYYSSQAMGAGRRAVAAYSSGSGTAIRAFTDEAVSGEDNPPDPIAAVDAYIGWANGADPPMPGKTYAILAVSGAVTQTELLSILPVAEGGGGLDPWTVWGAARILRAYLPQLAYASGADVVIPDVAEALGGPLAAVNAVMAGGGLERVVNTAGDVWPMVAGPQVHDVDIVAVWAGEDANVPLAFLSEWALPDGVDPASSIAWAAGTTAEAKVAFLAGVASGAITIEGNADSTGGADGLLDLIGLERGLPRASGELDPAYRARLCALPDVVSPAAIRRAVDALLAPHGVTCSLWEPPEFGFGFGRGAFGRDCPTRAWHGLVRIPPLPYDRPGFGFGRGAFGRAPFGTDDASRAAVYAGAQAMVDRIKGAGIWVSVREATS